MVPLIHGTSRRQFLTAMGGLGLCGCFWGCRSVPITERRQMLLIPENKEIAMGAEAYQAILSESRLSSDQRLSEMVQRVGRRVTGVSDERRFRWEFNLIADPTPNAFCLPGGKVAINEGMLEVCQDEAGVAAVLGHEIGHALARHGGERMSQNLLADQSKLFLERVSGNQAAGRQEILMMAYGAGTQFGVLLPFSRKHELEADQIGTLLMAKAGYDPVAAPRLWQRFSQLDQGERPLEFASTHPSDHRRVEELQRILDRAQQDYHQAKIKFGLGEPV